MFTLFLESRKYKIKTRYENCMLNIELVHQKSAQEQIKTMNERSDEKGRKSIDLIDNNHFVIMGH